MAVTVGSAYERGQSAFLQQSYLQKPRALQSSPRLTLSAKQSSVLQVQLQGENRHRPAVSIVGRVVDELIIEGDVGKADDSDAVICFQDLLGAGIRQLAVADNPAQTASGELQLALVRDSIGYAGQSHRVIRPPPARTGQRETRRDRLVDVGEIDSPPDQRGFDIENGSRNENNS